MGDIPVERKLQMVRQLRSQYYKNRYDLANREQILYGKSSLGETDLAQNEPIYKTDEDYFNLEQKEVTHSSFRIRFLVAIVLFVGIIFLDKNGIKIAGTDMSQVFRTISADYYSEFENFVEAMAQPAEEAASK